jgi:two-component system cell cycle sensor histidine kinase/response regulator CckA
MIELRSRELARTRCLVAAAKRAARCEGDLKDVVADLALAAREALRADDVRLVMPSPDRAAWMDAHGDSLEGPEAAEVVAALAAGVSSVARGARLSAAVRRSGVLVGLLRAERATGGWAEDEVALGEAFAELVSLAMDVVEARESDVARRQNEEREREQRRHELVARLSGGIAHDVNNVLTGVLGWAEKARRIGTPDAKRIASEIERCVARAGALTQRLLAIGRRQVFSPVAIDPGSLLTRQLERYRQILGEGVAIDLRLEAIGSIHADEAAVEEVLRQLVANAGEALGGQGRLSLRTRDAGGGVLIEIADNGCGMTPATSARAFEPFFTTRPPGGGAGLGLAVVEGLVRQGGGEVTIDSTFGKGTTVRVWWPAARALYVTPPAAPPRLVADGPGARMVLLVEDEPDLRKLVASHLRKNGHEVIEAEDGQAALDRVLPLLSQVDVVVTDVVMPRLDGRELARRLRERRADLPVLYVSGCVSGDSGFALEPGERFLAKPFTMGALSRTLATILGGRVHAER